MHFSNGEFNTTITILDKTKEILSYQYLFISAQINKCWYDIIYFVLLSIIAIFVLIASFEKYVKTHNGMHTLKVFCYVYLLLCDEWGNMYTETVVAINNNIPEFIL
jgi:hypothetical protein